MVTAIQALHAADPAKVDAVAAKMLDLGAPEVRAVVDSDGFAWAVEGVHRLAAASELGLVPVVVEVSRDDLVADLGLDWQDADAGSTVGDLLDYFESCSNPGAMYYL